MLSLKLLGVVSLSSEGTPVAGPAAQRRRLALLSILAGSAGGISREKIIWYLWPDVDSKQARHLLADSLYAVRKLLGQDSIVASGDNLSLNPGSLRSDVEEFRRALSRGDLEAAVKLYDGPFLDGFFLPDASEFERWADTERSQLQREFAHALETLAIREEKKGNSAEAVAWWRRLQAVDPLNGRVALSLMKALDASGDRTAALRHGQVHQALIHDELGLPADPAVTALSERLLTSEPPANRAEPGRGEVPPAVPVTLAPSAAGATFSAPPATASRPKPIPGRRVAGVALIVAAGVIAGALMASGTRLQKQTGFEGILVTTFENRTGDPTLEPLGSMAADWIARGLMEVENIEVFSPTWTVRGADTGGPELAARTGAGTVISGAFYIDAKRLRLQAQITDAARGRILQTLDPVDVPPDSATSGVELLRQRVTAAVAARFDRSVERKEITSRALPPTYESYREYVAGIQLFSQREPVQALQHFDRAWKLDSTFHLARLFSVLALQLIGNSGRADSIVADMSVGGERMAAFDRALLEVFKADLAGDPQGALRWMREVAARTPASQFVVGHAVLAVAANRPREARDVLLKADPRSGLLREYPGYWEWLTVARHLLGEHRDELREAREARSLHPGFRRGLSQEVRALAALGRVEEVELLVAGPLQLQPPETPADLIRLAAIELRAHGHRDAAARAFDKAIAWYVSRPQEEGARHRPAYAQTLYEAGRLAEASTLYAGLASAQPSNLAVLGRLGVLAARRGDRVEANRISQALIDPPSPSLRGTHLVWRARIAARLGEIDAARALLRDAYAAGAHHGLWLHTDPDLASLN